MSCNYKFHNPDGLYFISFAAAGWPKSGLVFRAENYRYSSAVDYSDEK
ncbi:hypothetical protein M2347_004114 [Chryseobacterium sp. H1D6B]|nr:hypothetical protein [Chryseobacterium sp. H1D6B]MDH6254387.1 hypothetical protein [Chryseobacterium sp. H1D6B]